MQLLLFWGSLHCQLKQLQGNDVMVIREIPSDGGGTKIVATRQTDPRHLNAVPPLMLAINVHHYRQMPLDIANHKEGVIMEISDNGCAAPQLCRPPIPFMIIAEGTIVHHG